MEIKVYRAKNISKTWSERTIQEFVSKRQSNGLVWPNTLRPMPQKGNTRRNLISLNEAYYNTAWELTLVKNNSWSNSEPFWSSNILPNTHITNQYVDRKAPSDKNVWSVIDLRSTGTVGIRELKSWRGNCLKLQRSMLMNLKSQESEMTSGLHAHARCYSDAPVFLRLLLFACMAHISFLTFCDSCCFACSCSSYLQFYFGTLWNSLSSVPVPCHWHMHMFAEFVRDDDLHTKKQRHRVNRTTQVPDAGMAPCSRVPCHEWQGNT
jgi:hypothetical protein